MCITSSRSFWPGMAYSSPECQNQYIDSEYVRFMWEQLELFLRRPLRVETIVLQLLKSQGVSDAVIP